MGEDRLDNSLLLADCWPNEARVIRSSVSSAVFAVIYSFVTLSIPFLDEPCDLAWSVPWEKLSILHHWSALRICLKGISVARSRGFTGKTYLPR
jgi:hypothetical protein